MGTPNPDAGEEFTTAGTWRPFDPKTVTSKQAED
jgi:hypothetical protein